MRVGSLALAVSQANRHTRTLPATRASASACSSLLRRYLTLALPRSKQPKLSSVTRSLTPAAAAAAARRRRCPLLVGRGLLFGMEARGDKEDSAKPSR